MKPTANIILLFTVVLAWGLSWSSIAVQVGALIGIGGLALLLVSHGGTAVTEAPKPTGVAGSLVDATGIGLLLALAGTYCFSLGNIVSTRMRGRTDETFIVTER